MEQKQPIFRSYKIEKQKTKLVLLELLLGGISLFIFFNFFLVFYLHEFVEIIYCPLLYPPI